jgi:threonine/homoserine/homoserine lactone efflux protein
MEDPILFVLAVLTILGTPGPTNTLLATSGAAAGVRASLPLVPAEAAGYLIAILAIGLALGPAVAALPLLAAALRLGVGAYLLVLAVRLWQRGGGALVQGGRRVVTPRQIFTTTLLNPKAIVFALGVVPFSAPRPHLYLLGFAAMLGAVALCWIGAGAALGRAAAGAGRAGMVPRVGAAAVAAFALVLVSAPLLR